MLGTSGIQYDMKIPMVEIFQTVEGEGTRAGFPTTFVRVFNCNLRCTWCDTKYSYAPYKPEFTATIGEIVEQVKRFPNKHICLTGGEPLIHGERSLMLLKALAEIDYIEDIHIETNGAINISEVCRFRESHPNFKKKIRFILDYKLPSSGEMKKMILENFDYSQDNDEVKFVISDSNDFEVATRILKKLYKKGTVLFSPVWETMPPDKLVNLVLSNQLVNVKVSLQLHKIIWDPNKRGV
ncbi:MULTISPECIES: 7-carboxy-7-deazaguanine synthase QueE [Aneurinibacillus]|uniref:7-carboxy-7-deazaguanine synthase n=1 Tax=Aneurinibacillus thermoaerophilus TaxID=143495 RepID=A0ABX8YEK7_ANETH|nr:MULTISPECIES: radical SAM protein [Aneurinibacillus]AMA73385.1 radical SAM protein [Aneurinibacillus sp. XH2]MED0736329.1 radical SAM protein [Aneurinibacillus thermoaerophilus]QYY44052.1 radical SAM protein [Aneurinibacillus thermoaerophilus]